MGGGDEIDTLTTVEMFPVFAVELPRLRDPRLGNLWSKLRRVTSVLNAAGLPQQGRLNAAGLCSGSCHTANWISRCETDMIVSSVIQFQTHNDWILSGNQTGHIVRSQWYSIYGLWAKSGPWIRLLGGRATIFLITMEINGLTLGLFLASKCVLIRRHWRVWWDTSSC